MRPKFKEKNYRRRKYIIIIAVLFIFIVSYLVIFLTLPLKLIYAKNLPNPVSTSGTLQVSWPNSAEASIGVLGYGSLTSNGVQTPTPTASISKLVTALAVVKKYPLSLGQQGPTITISAADVADYNSSVAQNGSVVRVVLGEQISEYQALQAMLLPSANNIADTLANWAYGSTPNYIISANQIVKSLGMNSTTIADASGFSPSTVSTSNDLVKLGETTLNNPVIAQIVGQASTSLPIVGLVNNVDVYVGQHNLIGIKTGNTDQAGGCFLSAAKYSLGSGKTITVIGAVMKAPSLQLALQSTVPMLQSVKNQLQLKTVSGGTPVTTYSLPWGGSVNAETDTALLTPYLPGMPVTYTNKTGNIAPPAIAHEIVGSVNFGVGNDKSSTNVILSHDLPMPSVFWRLTHPQYFI